MIHYIRFRAGQWVREWLQNVDAYLNGTNRADPKAFFYGAHELNIGAILVAFGIREFDFPYFCSSLMLELLETENEFYVKVCVQDNSKVDYFVYRIKSEQSLSLISEDF